MSTQKQLHPILLPINTPNPAIPLASVNGSDVICCYREVSSEYINTEPVASHPAYIPFRDPSERLIKQWGKDDSAWGEPATTPPSYDVILEWHWDLVGLKSSDKVDVIRIKSDKQPITVFDIVLTSEILLYRINHTDGYKDRFDADTEAVTTKPVSKSEIDITVWWLLSGWWRGIMQSQGIDHEAPSTKEHLYGWIRKMDLQEKLSSPKEEITTTGRTLLERDY